jgi:O-antigen ligase
MARTRSLPVSAIGTCALVAVAVFYVAYDDGSYSLASRSTIAIAVWWAILVGIGLGVWPRGRIPRGAVAVGLLLAAFAAWDLASTAWAASAENAYAEFDRTVLYLGVYVLAVLSTSARTRAAAVDGLTAAITAVAVVALVSRFFPGSFPGRGVSTLLPSARTRLSFPLDYWNGLGIFTALAFPLLLRSTLVGSRLRRGTAVAAVPALASVVYLSSSRGAVAALAGGIVVFVVAQPRRSAALGSVAVATAGAAAAIAVLAARSEDWLAALALVLICAATAAVFEAAAAVVPRLELSARDRRRLRAAAIVVILLGAIAGAVGAALALRDFTRLPTGVDASGGAHLVSGAGSGRWQFWAAAIHEFADSPLHGRGAGSFQAWWLQHGSFRYFVVNAHSLYIETLGELGIVGFLLIMGVVVAGVVVSVRRLLGSRDVERALNAALLATFAVYLIGAGVDWMWQLTAVTVAGVFVLGLATGPATASRAPTGPFRLAIAAVAVCAVIVAEAIPLLADVEVRKSQADVRAGDVRRARAHARDATKLEPWAATPYLQLALVDETAGELTSARVAIDHAVRRDDADWRLWFIAARIERRLGDTAAAGSLARARALNPRSPLLSQRT